MRLSWFTSLRAGRRRKGKRHQLKAAPLRVRQLERRRVLDAAVSSVVVSTIVVADAGQSPPPVTTTNATDAPPIVVPVQSPAGNSSSGAAFAASFSPGEGLGANVPPVLVAATNQQVNEGQTLDLSASGGAPPLGLYIDPDLADTHTATVDWGDGSGVQNATVIAGVGAGALGGTHVYGDNGNYTVTVSVADNNGGSASQKFDVLVKNLPPVLVTATDQTVNEGQLLDLSAQGGAPALGLFVDPGFLDTHTATVNWGDGSPTQNATVSEAMGAGALGGTHTYADNGSYTVTVTVTDDDGGSDSEAFNVMVKNVPPVLVVAADQTVNEGQLLDLSAQGGAQALGLFIDQGVLDTHTATVNWGDGSPTQNATVSEAMGAGAIGGTHTYADNGLYTVTVIVTDDDGGSASGTFKVTVNNVAPFVDLTGPSTVNEGSANTWHLGPVVDPGTDTVTQYVIHWGDGNTDTFTAAQIAGMAGNIGHTYADGPNNYTIAVDLVDEDGTFLAVDTLAVAVNNVPPFVDLTGPTAVNEGVANNWMLGAVVDPGTDTVSQYVIHWGDGNTDTFTAAQIAGMANTIGHTYVEGPNNYTISVDLVDEDGTFLNVDSLNVTVANVAPTVALNAVPDISENGVATLTGSFTDSGVRDAHTVTVNWADANNSSPSTFAVPAIQNSAGTPTLSVGNTFNSSTDAAILTITSINVATGQVGFSVQHQYLDDGLAPGNNTNSDPSLIGVTVVDDDADSGSGNTMVTVHNVTPGVALSTAANISENAVATLSGSYTDIGLLDAHIVTVNWNDPNNGLASTFAVSAIRNAAGTATLSVGNTFNSSTDSAVLTITSINAATGQVGFSVQHQYLDDGLAPGNNTPSDTVTIGVTVADDDAESSNTTVNVIVNNVAPSVALNSVPDVNENSVATLTGSYTDIGKLDAHTLTVHWDDPNNGLDSTFAISAIQNAAGTATLHVGDTVNSSTDSAVLTITSIDAATGQVGFSVQHQYLDDGLALGNNTISDVSMIGVTVADDDAQNGSNTTPVSVHNVSPDVALNSVSDIDEHGIATLTGTYTDIGLLDAHTVTVDWDDPNNGLNSTFAVSAIQNAAGTATLHVGDTFSSSTDSAILTITSIDVATGKVGYSVQHQYLDDGLALGNNTTSDPSTIGVTVADDDAQSGSDTVTFTVHNVAPAVVLNAVPDINENGVATLTGNYTDVGLLDAHAVTIDWDDPNNGLHSTFAVSAIQNAAGTATLHVGDAFSSSTDSATLTITSLNAATGQVSFTVQHQYLDDGLALGNNTASDVSTIGVTVADDDAQSGSQTATITVHNVTPAVALNAVPDINENGVATLTGSFTDIGLLDAHVLTVNWADANNALASTFAVSAIRNAGGTATLSIGNTFNSSTDTAVLTITAIDATTGQVSFSVQHQYLDDGVAPGNGTISDTSTVTVTVKDDDAQSGSKTTTVTVNNVAPVFTNVMGDSINESQVATISLNVVDPGTLDVFRFNVDWRDGSTATISGSGATNATGTVGATDFTWTAATRQLTLSHLYPDNADYQVVVRMADDDMGANFAGAPSAANFVQQTTLVTVANLAPTLTGTTNLAVDEGSAVTLAGLGVHIQDLGFDNPANQTPPPLGNLTTEEFSTFSIDWGDGFTTPAVDVVGRVSGSAINTTTASPTTAQFMHDPHYYADDGVYTVTVRMADDNMGAFSNPSLFTTGVAGVDYVDRQFQVLVKNVTPTLGVTNVASQQQTGAGVVTTTPITPATTITVNESGTVSLAAGFTDPGFSLDPNPTSPAGTTFPKNEIFRYYINWGDNRETVGQISAANVASLSNGGPTVLTSGAFDTAGMIHTYADDGTYTVTVRLADDNMGAFADTSKFANGVGVGFGTDKGGDYVGTTFTVVVNNIAPSFVPQPGGANVVGTQVSSQGFTTINVAFSDPGFDNTANLNASAPPTITDTHHESFTHVIDWGDGTVDAVHTYTDASSHDVTITRTGPGGTQTFNIPGVGAAGNVLTLVSGQDINNPGAVAQPFTYVVDWGDGNVQTISLMLKTPGTPTVNGQTAVGSLVRTSGNVGVTTTGSFGITHQYLGPPDPLNPTNNIKIAVSVVDDNNASVSDFVTITNPGITTINVAIDTTPDVPRLALPAQTLPPVILDQQSAAPTSVQASLLSASRFEETTTEDRFLELVVVSPDGIETDRYRLNDESLSDLRGLFATLPDNRYKIYLVRTGNYSRRLVIDVFVRRGRVIDPSDKSEGTRDRPPTAEVTQQINDQNKNGQQNNLQPNGAPQQQVVPLQKNPLLQRVPDDKKGAAIKPNLPADGAADAAAPLPDQELSEAQPTRSRASMKWALPLAGLGLVASRESWSERLGTALESADDATWERLRRAGRLGKSAPRTRVGSGKVVCEAEQPS
jgi:hypothetical protein